MDVPCQRLRAILDRVEEGVMRKFPDAGDLEKIQDLAQG
jgi:hypothetical protein